MTKAYLILLLALLPAILLCQAISNLRITQDEIGIYKASFDLNGNADRLYTITVTAKKDGKLISPKAISGSVNDRGELSSGKDLLLLWDPVLEGYPASGWTLSLSAKYISNPLVYVPGGTFHNGTSNVTLSSFFIGKYEVTQQQWQEVMEGNPSKWKGDSLPVERVSWSDCVEFYNRLSRKEGLTPCYSGSGNNITCDWTANGYRLPTEAEWEYAARGGKQSKGYTYAGSNDLGSVAWYDGNSGSQTHPVGGKQPNELGIYDLTGNVWEWCWDWYGDYNSSSQTNPHGSDSGSYRVLRGGSWSSVDFYCRVSYRGSINPDSRNNSIGLRLLRAAQ